MDNFLSSLGEGEEQEEEERKNHYYCMFFPPAALPSFLPSSKNEKAVRSFLVVVVWGTPISNIVTRVEEKEEEDEEGNFPTQISL